MKAYALAAIAAAIFAGGYYVRDLQESASQLAIERVLNAVNEIKAKQIEAIKIENKTVYAKTVERIKTEVMYSECKQDETMLQLTNYSLTGK